MEPNDLYAFLRDPKLLELIELNKTTDDFLDVVKLNENQNSEILAWCMNPNEGHAQGDAVIKDFLEAAYTAGESCTWDNKKFFSKWTPGRIRTSSFGAAFVTRELAVKVSNGEKNGRLDLFLVDPLNKILVTIENKIKASLNSEQLEKYVQAVKTGLASRKVFSDYDLAFIVIDKDLDYYSSEHLETLGNRWALLDYNWLTASANRARFQLERGNTAAQLLATYCQSVTNWENSGSRKVSELSADLVLTHSRVIETMRDLNGKSLDRWVSSSLEGHSGELTLFLAQHRKVCERLLSIRGVASLVPRLLKASPILSQDFIEEGSYWIAAMPPAARDLMRDERWPIYIDMYRVTKASSASAPKFNVKLVWVRGEFDPTACSEEKLRNFFDKHFSGLGKFVSSDTRRLLISEHVSPTEAIEVTAKLITTLESGIPECLSK